jgi:hypothetical protein
MVMSFLPEARLWLALRFFEYFWQDELWAVFA